MFDAHLAPSRVGVHGPAGQTRRMAGPFLASIGGRPAAHSDHAKGSIGLTRVNPDDNHCHGGQTWACGMREPCEGVDVMVYWVNTYRVPVRNARDIPKGGHVIIEKIYGEVSRGRSTGDAKKAAQGAATVAEGGFATEMWRCGRGGSPARSARHVGRVHRLGGSGSPPRGIERFSTLEHGVDGSE